MSFEFSFELSQEWIQNQVLKIKSGATFWSKRDALCVFYMYFNSSLSFPE